MASGGPSGLLPCMLPVDVAGLWYDPGHGRGLDSRCGGGRGGSLCGCASGVCRWPGCGCRGRAGQRRVVIGASRPEGLSVGRSLPPRPSCLVPARASDLPGVIAAGAAFPIQHHPGVLGAFGVLRRYRMPSPAVRTAEFVAGRQLARAHPETLPSKIPIEKPPSGSPEKTRNPIVGPLSQDENRIGPIWQNAFPISKNISACCPTTRRRL